MMKQPTAGLGQVRPSPRRASENAARIHRWSSAAAMSALAVGQTADEILEVLGFAEITVNAGKPDIGDRVQAFERFHDQRPDTFRRDFGLAGLLDAPDDAVDGGLDPALLDR